MNSRHYRLRLHGLDSPSGTIRARELHEVLSALLATSERAVRVAALGESASAGGKPGWLKASLDFVVTGISEGSTVLEIDAPCLGETALDQFSQQDFWIAAPRAEDTALSLAAAAVQEAGSPGMSGERFDAGVLSAVLKIGKVLPRTASVELLPGAGATGGFHLDATAFERLEERKKQLPPPRAFVVSGTLDRIEHSRRRFVLVLPDSHRLAGRSHTEFLDLEQLRTLWGRKVTLEGMVHFKPNGTPRMMEARKLKPQEPGEEMFERMPGGLAVLAEPELFPQLRPKAAGDPMKLWNTWPGEESVEELLAALK
jgi:hypothetical protein